MTKPAKRHGSETEAFKAQKFKPGQSGNESGRRAIPDFVKGRGPDMWRHLLELADGTKKDRRVSRAQAVLEVIDRLYGRPAQAVDVTGPALSPAAAAFLALVEVRKADAEAKAKQITEGEKS